MNKPKPGEDLPALFRSLRPDHANDQATLNAAAQEAQQRWPLFRAIAPKKPELTPALTTEERQRWSRQDKPGTGKPKPALSRPGSGDQLTQSLSKMSGLAGATAGAATSATASEQNTPLRELARRTRETPTKAAGESPSMLFSRPAPVEAPAVEVKPVGLALFGKKAAEEVMLHHDAPPVIATDDSLASIFSRLVEKEEIVSKPVVKRSSFLGRLGKK